MKGWMHKESLANDLVKKIDGIDNYQITLTTGNILARIVEDYLEERLGIDDLECAVLFHGLSYWRGKTLVGPSVSWEEFSQLFKSGDKRVRRWGEYCPMKKSWRRKNNKLMEGEE